MIRSLSCLMLCLFLSACGGRFSSPYATGHYASTPTQCVPFARAASGINLHGDAYTWWNQTPPARRGHWPTPGAVLVLAKTPRMTHGHLAVVKRIIDARHIDVTHSNWGNDWNSRRKIYELVRVEDVSPLNDWTQLRFWNDEANCFGFPYAAMGFIYKM